jgi:uncharacterized protein (DUF983 family)
MFGAAEGKPELHARCLSHRSKGRPALSFPEPSRPISPWVSGVLARCPRCGTGKLFAGFLQLAPSCSSCSLNYDFADAGDGPAVFVILFAGFLVAGGALVTELVYQPPYWLHALIWGPLAVLVPMAMLRPFKGVLVALQYANAAREGRHSNGR